VADMDPEIEWIGPAMLPDAPRVYRGHDGVRAFWAVWDDVFEQFRAEIEETIDSGDHVVVMVRINARGRDGIVVETPVYPHVWTVHDGKLVRLEMMPSRTEALESVGIEKGFA
jgi:ketosteroid isomerase-like protein